MSWSKLAGKPVDDGVAWSLPHDSGLQSRDEEIEFGLGVGRETDSHGEKSEESELGIAVQSEATPFRLAQGI